MNDQLVNSSSELSAAIPDNTNSNFTSDSSDNTPRVIEKIGGAGTILGLAVGGSAVGAILYARKTRSLLEPNSILSDSNLKTNSNSKENTIRIDQANRKLQKKLLTLVHNERDTANRLLFQAQIRNPNRTIDWCVEKVIYDLERDRGRY